MTTPEAAEPTVDYEALVEMARQVDDCDRHGSAWCSCKVRQFLDLMGLEQVGWMDPTNHMRVWPRTPNIDKACREAGDVPIYTVSHNPREATDG